MILYYEINKNKCSMINIFLNYKAFQGYVTKNMSTLSQSLNSSNEIWHTGNDSVNSFFEFVIEWRQWPFSFSHVTKVVSFWFLLQSWPQLDIKCLQIEKNDHFSVYVSLCKKNKLVRWYITNQWIKDILKWVFPT